MTRAKKESRKAQTTAEIRREATWGGFVDLELTAEERRGFEEWYESNANVEAFVRYFENLMKHDLKLSFVYQERDTSILVSAMYTDAKERKNYVLSARHEDVISALMLLAYKHFIVLDSDWSAAASGMRQMSLWG